MDRDNQKPLAIGLEMSAGQWILEADGTLHFYGGDLLVGGAFGSRRRLVKRILIDDFWFVAEGLFESFPECEEVIFSRAFVQISSRAFAHCPKLKNVQYGDADIATDAFRDTPYQAALDGVPYVLESQQEIYLGLEAHGKRFLERMHKVTEDMETLKGPSLRNYDWEWDDHDWFEDCFSALQEGRKHGESSMMFLFAELYRYSTGYRLDFCTDEEMEMDSSHWYLEAAKAGSVHAMLWCAWCMERGINGFPKDPVSSAEILEHMPKIPKTLGLSELYFLKDELFSLVEQAHDADLEEDELGFEYRYKHEEYDHLMPDPGWRTLHLRCIELSCMMVRMGLPYVLEEHGYSYQWNSTTFRSTADQVRQEKGSLLEWCREKGMEIELE